MLKFKLAVYVVMLSFMAIIYTDGVNAAYWGNLRSKVQDEIDGNIFLKRKNIKLRINDESNGYVIIEMYQGNRLLREQIHKGSDIMISQVEQSYYMMNNIGEDENISLSILRKTIEVIKNISGVKEVLLVSVINTPNDLATDSLSKGFEYQREEKFSEALEMYSKAIELVNLPEAQTAIGYMYFNGKGVQKDELQALEWFRKAADQGYAKAQHRLGIMYSNSKDVQKDERQALEWFQKAADQGDINAANSLAWLYATSNQYQDGAKAVEWGLKATSSSPENPIFFETLAAAYAREGLFDLAISSQNKSNEIFKTDNKLSREGKEKQLSNALIRLDLYKNKKPYTE